MTYGDRQQPAEYDPHRAQAPYQPQPQSQSPWQEEPTRQLPLQQPSGYQQQWQPHQGQPQHQWQPHQGQWQQPVQPFPQPPAKKSRTGLWIGLVAGAVALILLVGCGVTFALFQFGRDPADRLSASSPAGSRSPSLPPKKPAAEVSLARPEKIGNRNRITTGEYAAKVTKAEDSLRPSLKPGGSLVVAFYGTTDPKVDQIYIVASTFPNPITKSQFDTQFEKVGPSIGGKPTTNIVDVPAGMLNGFMKCGQTISDGMDVVACGFSNGYYYAVVQWYNRKLNDAIKKESVTIRSLIEK